MPVTCELPVPAQKQKKVYIKRLIPDGTQRARFWVQTFFFALSAWIGVQFYFFVRQFELAENQGITRPPGVEGWLPIAGLMNLKSFLLTGQIPEIHPAAMFLLVSFLAISWLLRKAFCSWLCPVGTLSEWLWKFGRKTFRRNINLPKWLDISLRSLKYILLGLFGYAVGSMDVASLQAFLQSPYGLVADVKMLNFFRYLSVTAAVTLGVFLIASVLIKNFWCRYLCPYGGLMGLFSMLSPVRIKREPEKCIDCAKCAKVCPSNLPVDVLVQIKSAECLGCLECVAICPAEGALDLALFGKKPVGTPRTQPWIIVAFICTIFFGIVGYAKYTGHWHSPIPDQLYQHLIPQAQEFNHP